MPAIKNLFRLYVLVICSFLTQNAESQDSYSFSIVTRPEVCLRGSASVSVTGTAPNDKISMEWSNGATNFSTLRDLEAGEYWVRFVITSSKDTTTKITDTTLHFTIAKERCPVAVPRHFSPNSDGYNDDLRLGNIEKYPNFEFQLFNRWGQLVHRQRNNFLPWAGDWNGVPLPDGTYYYILFYDVADKKQLQKGDITILR